MKYFQKDSSKVFYLFIIARLILFVSVPLNVIPGYGDYWNFFAQAKLGIPFIDFWTEFPPFFPFLSQLIYALTGGRESSYSYVLAIVISLFQAGSVALALELAKPVYQEQRAAERIWVYFAITIGLFYSWSYFDPIAVFFTLLGIFWLTKGHDYPAAIAIAAGVLTKWFPIVVIPAVWKIRSRKEAISITLFILIFVLIVWGGLYLLNPEMTLASLSSQANKGSWETIWALIDKNLSTGNFHPQINRLDPITVRLTTGNSAVIPPLITLIFFGGLGFILLIKSNLRSNLGLYSLIGLSLVILFLWSPGYSPQWILYLLPFIFLCLNRNEAYLMSTILVLVNLLEWPILLSRGSFESLNYLIPLRTIIMLFLGIRLYMVLKDSKSISEGF